MPPPTVDPDPLVAPPVGPQELLQQAPSQMQHRLANRPLARLQIGCASPLPFLEHAARQALYLRLGFAEYFLRNFFFS